MNQTEIKSEKETIYFILSVIFSITVYLFILFMTQLLGIIILLAIFFLLTFYKLISLGSIKGNGVKITESQFPDIHQKLVHYCQEMNIKKVPDMFVIESMGILNAFATRFWGNNMVVIYSEAFELARQQNEEELDFIIAHELAHIKHHHVWKSILVTPARLIPILSQAYSRACEYTCDREATYIIQNPEAAKRALTILGIGKVLFKDVNTVAYRQQIETESHFGVWLSEIFSSHPLTPKRIQSIALFSGSTDGYVYEQRYGPIITGLATCFGIYILIIILIPIGLTVSSFVYGDSSASSVDEREEADRDPGPSSQQAMSTIEEDEQYEEVSKEEDEFEYEYKRTELFDPILMSDYQSLETLINDGADLEEADELGYTALQYSIQFDSPTAFHLLLNAGADPNSQSSTDHALQTAIFYENKAAVNKLIEYGADVNMLNDYDVSPLVYSIQYEYFTITELLLENDADPNLMAMGTTPLYFALELEDFETAILLLDYGADPSIVDDYDEDILTITGFETAEALYEELESLIR
ncbi:M48 family metallopeptidase [Alkalihalobacillus hemicellulosilyticus]|uniref:M48 family metallopeptidase n=1 Tax=Halalkalibacter hemicellulosilyticus TaxID=127886 RepID=UPI00068E0EE5|nr:M48 family metalloprotease [Halalkalibacter hemicellulosilyticus]